MRTVDRYHPSTAKPEHFGNITAFKVADKTIRQTINKLINQSGFRLSMIKATDDRAADMGYRVWYVLSAPGSNTFVVPYVQILNGSDFTSISDITPAATNYEREIKTFFGLSAAGNPDQRQIQLHENWPEELFPLLKGFRTNSRPAIAKGKYSFREVKGEGIYEIPVGPIHAGIIEPGHFRFSVAGEEIVLLEPKLGYVHKGSEKLFEKFDLDQKLKLSEKISGDSSFSHSLAFCQAIESLTETTVPNRALYLRTIFAEMERLANHFGDIGLIMHDCGFNFGGGQGARHRELIMRISEKLTASRFLRNVNTVGGVNTDISQSQKDQIEESLSDVLHDFEKVIEVAENSTSLLNRLKETGILSNQIAKDHAVMGVAGKAAGIALDGRVDHPYAAYGLLNFSEISTETSGDVYARFRVRVREVRTSIKLIMDALGNLSDGLIKTKTTLKFKKNAIAIGCVEGWRGEILYFVTTDEKGLINRVAVRDPSFVNWQVLGYCGLGQMVPDFPLINKSFNLSYSGHDL